jgi:hypothetical protein
MQLARHLTATDPQILNRQGTYDPPFSEMLLPYNLYGYLPT